MIRDPNDIGLAQLSRINWLRRQSNANQSQAQSSCDILTALRTFTWWSLKGVVMTVSVVDQLRESDKAYHLHPFTDHADMHRTGTHIVYSGEGIYVVDENGKKLLDGLAGLWCVNVGYG